MNFSDNELMTLKQFANILLQISHIDKTVDSDKELKELLTLLLKFSKRNRQKLADNAYRSIKEL